MLLDVCQGVFEDFFDTLDLIAKFFSLGLPSGTDFCKFRPSISGGKDLIRPPYKTFFLYDCERLERLRRSFGSVLMVGTAPRFPSVCKQTKVQRFCIIEGGIKIAPCLFAWSLLFCCSFREGIFDYDFMVIFFHFCENFSRSFHIFLELF